MTPEMRGANIRALPLVRPPFEVVDREFLGAQEMLIGEAHRIRAAVAGSQRPAEAGGAIHGVTLEPVLVAGLETRSSAACNLI